MEPDELDLDAIEKKWGLAGMCGEEPAKTVLRLLHEIRCLRRDRALDREEYGKLVRAMAHVTAEVVEGTCEGCGKEIV